VEAVVLDFVNPAGGGGRLLRETRQARLQTGQGFFSPQSALQLTRGGHRYGRNSGWIVSSNRKRFRLCQIAAMPGVTPGGNVHLVRDAVSVDDALHIAVLHHFFQTPHYGNAGQLQRVGDLTCANRRASDRAQEDADAANSRP
jgi:hypothetical protein